MINDHLNNYMIRLAQLDAALAMPGRYKIDKAGFVTDTIHAEIEQVKKEANALIAIRMVSRV